jgi:hypothetical protein
MPQPLPRSIKAGPVLHPDEQKRDKERAKHGTAPSLSYPKMEPDYVQKQVGFIRLSETAAKRKGSARAMGEPGQ